LVKFAVPKFPSGGWVPPDTVVISSIHSAEFAGPVYVKFREKLTFKVRSEMSMVHVVPETLKISADM
jgi:hypothetical protein